MSKCTFDGTKYVPCAALSGKLEEPNGHTKGLSLLALVNMTKNEEYFGGLIYKYGKKKDEKVLCNYCPACGVQISPIRTPND